jgi:hypothetical protein
MVAIGQILVNTDHKISVALLIMCAMLMLHIAFRYLQTTNAYNNAGNLRRHRFHEDNQLSILVFNIMHPPQLCLLHEAI